MCDAVKEQVRYPAVKFHTRNGMWSASIVFPNGRRVSFRWDESPSRIDDWVRDEIDQWEKDQ
jgi:hypothetical protein